MDEAKKDIKDYLHLYLGCDIWTGTGKVTLFSIRKEVVPLTSVSFGVINGNHSHELKWNEECKLILRPLSDMKIEEGAWCLQETFFPQANYPISDFRMELVGQKQNNPRISIDNDWFTDELTFGCTSGSIWSAKDTLPCNIKLQATVFHYLIKQGFDMFGLIEAGLAIDKTKI